MYIESKAYEIENKIDNLEYELKIARLNDRVLDAEVLQNEIRDLENELISLGY